jgi:hypothetical protein
MGQAGDAVVDKTKLVTEYIDGHTLMRVQP